MYTKSSPTYLTIGSDTGRTTIDRMTWGMTTDIDYSLKHGRHMTLSLQMDKLGYYDFMIVDNHSQNGLMCKVGKKQGFISCIPLGVLEIEP